MIRKQIIIILFISFFICANSVVFAQNRAKSKIEAKSDSINQIDSLLRNIKLKEVVVTAKEKVGPVTASVIARDAMQLLQPTSIADLMELLPGGYSKDPNMSAANGINLRETGTMGAYGDATSNNHFFISSLGTQFVVDGVPISTDANLQFSPLSSVQSTTSGTGAEDSRNITNRGVDMRSIGTDDIENVEVIRGIPSVEYGNLSSGMVNIKKIRRASPFIARFKADGYSKLISVGKGFAVRNNAKTNDILNLDLSFLSSKQNPTNTLENYKRVNASARFTHNSKRKTMNFRWESAFDYGGSFDNSKQDPDLNYGRIDEYKSSFSRIALTNNFNFNFVKSWLKRIEVNTSFAQQFDELRKTQLVAPQRYGIIPTSYETGEQEVKAVYNEYVAQYLCDGKPFTAYIKAKANAQFRYAQLLNDVKVGLNWETAKNFGKGQVYDLEKPLSVSSWSSRPRKYSDIPSLQNIAFFIENNFSLPFDSKSDVNTPSGGIEGLFGARFNSMVGLDKRFHMAGRIYVDPRASISLHLPSAFVGGDYLKTSITAGYGITSKMPTLNYLYPDPYYTNFISLAYYDSQNPTTDSKFVVTSFIQDPTNYNLRPARNHKFDLRIDFDWHDNSLSVNYFHENMTDGFRYSNTFNVYDYKAYDASAMGPGIDYHTLPFTNRHILDGYSQASNGSRLQKQGVEFQFKSARIMPLRTRIIVSGAWFRSRYTNSQPMLETVSAVIDNQVVAQKYVGLYDWVDGRTNDRFNTNVLFDTQIPEWGLIFATNVQFIWFTRTELARKNGVPVMYLAAEDGQLHPYTQESQQDIFLQQLIKSYNDDSFKPFTVPMSMTINLKATKTLGKFAKISVFANKLLDYLPDYKANGNVIRRSTKPYFGIEANLSF